MADCSAFKSGPNEIVAPEALTLTRPNRMSSLGLGVATLIGYKGKRTRVRYKKRMKKIFVIAALIVAMLAGSTSPSYAFLDKTRFVAHLGVAYFCFHHWALKPYQEGQFNAEAPHRTATMVKGGIALLFAYHEVKVSERIAQKSRDPLLQRLVGSMGSLTSGFASVGAKLKSGHFDPRDMESLNGVTKSLGSAAAAGGARIKDIPVAIPGT